MPFRILVRIDNVVHTGLERVAAVAATHASEDLDFLLPGVYAVSTSAICNRTTRLRKETGGIEE
jgi:hypothetical protein